MESMPKDELDLAQMDLDTFDLQMWRVIDGWKDNNAEEWTLLWVPFYRKMRWARHGDNA